MTSISKRTFLLILLFMLSACGGWRRGYFSMPYIGDPSSKASSAGKPAEQHRMQYVNFPGFSVNVDLENDIQTSDTAVAALVIPIHIDWEERWRYPPYKTGYYITLNFSSSIDGLAFAPLNVLLKINGKASKVSKARIFSPSKTWEAETRKRIAFSRKKGYFFQLHFDGIRPSPDDKVSLHLDKAIYHPQQLPIEEIKFIRRNWTSPYS